MPRPFIVVAVFFAVAVAGCDDGKAKVEAAGKKLDKAIDDFDVDDAKQHLNSAKDAIGRGLEAIEDCAWAATIAGDVVKEPVTELRRLCSFDAPLARATRAVENAEKARAEQPDAPSLTECSSDTWTKAARDLDASFASEPRWTAVKTRWKNVCPGP
jgi:hypothetical protein